MARTYGLNETVVVTTVFELEAGELISVQPGAGGFWFYVANPGRVFTPDLVGATIVIGTDEYVISSQTADWLYTNDTINMPDPNPTTDFIVQRSVSTFQYNITVPDKRVFAYSPSKLTVVGDASNAPVTFYWAYGSVLRRTDSSNKVVLPIQSILESFYAYTDTGEVASPTGYVNTASKCVLQNMILTISIPDYDIDILFDVVYGALQQAQSEPTEQNVYVFGSLPLTLTQSMGTWAFDNKGVINANAFGKDVYVNNVLLADPTVNTIKWQTALNGTDLKTFSLIKSTCEYGVYLRWLDPIEGYRYFLFNYGTSGNDTKDGSEFSRELDDLEPSESGVYKNQNQLIEVTGNPVETIGATAANYDVQKHIQTLQTSRKCWKYIGNNNWIEVTKKMSSIVIDEAWKQNQNIELQIILPNIYSQKL